MLRKQHGPFAYRGFAYNPVVRGVLLTLIFWPIAGLAQAPASADYVTRVRAVAERQIAEHPSIAGREHAVRWESSRGLVQCPVPARVTLAQRERLWGAVSVSLFCPSGRGVTQIMKAYVAVPGDYWRAKTALKATTPFKIEDWTKVRGDLGQFSEPLAGALVQSLDVVKGFESVRAIAPGRPLVLTDWQKMTVIKRGANVKVTLRGAGFDIAASGVSLDEGAVGDTVRVKTPEGKVLEGVAEADGSLLVLLN